MPFFHSGGPRSPPAHRAEMKAIDADLQRYSVLSPPLCAQEQKKSSKLEESMKMLDYEMKKTDDLLYRMIPKPVAKRLRKGEPAVNTCEVRIVIRGTNICSPTVCL